MYGIYGNIYHQYTPNVGIYIPYDWILWLLYNMHFPNKIGIFWDATQLAFKGQRGQQTHCHLRDSGHDRKPRHADLGQKPGDLSLGRAGGLPHGGRTAASSRCPSNMKNWENLRDRKFC